MPKPINATVGACPCPMPGCNETADVRRLKGHERGRLYLHCPRCHTVRTTAQSFQDYIEANATMDEGAPPWEESAPAPAPAASRPAPAPPPAASRPGPPPPRPAAGPPIPWTAPAPPPAKPAPVPGPAPARADSWDFELDDL